MIYLDNAATSFPKPVGVYSEVLKCMENYAANPGRGSHDMAIEASSKIMDTRQELSEIFNIPNLLNIVFTCNATEALNIGIKGILKPGDHVISTVIEHNSVLRPLNYLSKKGITFTLLGVDENGYLNINNLKKKIRRKTKAIIINHTSNVLGTIQDIRSIGQLAKESGIIFMVDASQSAGVIPIDVILDNIDLLAFPGHKGLYGPQGTGGLYIREGVDLDSFIQGGTGSDSLSMNQPHFLPDKFESGTLNTPGIAGLYEGLRFIKKIGIENIRKHEIMLVEYLVEELKKLSYIKIYGGTDYKNRGAVVSLNIDNVDVSEVGDFLNKKGIAVRTGFHCVPLIHGIIGTSKRGTVRISPGYFNNLEDIERLIKALIDIHEKSPFL
ncbi:aminotransferase class V-fold PLP-dependent enzyme [Clostridium estertheticum]|uniref:aminotransferase class V-fold PLP-dependent enzyme n=1 Tax=Clostridium estertheticum TaxID=238834 RepID=UPI001C6F1A1C|nr:aminotransferase class V-fold PLP-dependent enzyme [Clostridium estertheticum]MBW9152833.1 aminotransferase class V-fold PLP-dependent enzyme [Clostridium estertheticum]WLC85790.1 aminotransferase class V-fold PLP-dependent enzyme [Clostridium estertheticum]